MRKFVLVQAGNGFHGIRHGVADVLQSSLEAQKYGAPILRAPAGAPAPVST
jgi:hypothetical protein